MFKLARLLVVFLSLAVPLVLVSCSSGDPAIDVTKDFLKKATKGDKSLEELIDFDAAATKYGISPKELVQKEGEAKWKSVKEDVTNTIITTFSELKGSFKFSDFKVDEKGADYWIVSYKNPIDERKMMKVRKVDGKLKAYFYSK